MSQKRFKLKDIIISAILTLAIVASGFGVYFSAILIEKSVYPDRYAEFVEKYAAENDLEPSLVFAVIKTESNFNADAISPVGAQGLMQIMKSTADMLDSVHNREEAERDLLDAETNIKYGCEMLRWLLDQFYYQNTALAAYNAGHVNVKRWLDDELYSTNGVTLNVIPFEETAKFVRKVNVAAEKYNEIYYNGGSKNGN